MALTVAQAVAWTDKLAAIRVTSLGTAAAGFGLGAKNGSFGGWKKSDELIGLLMDSEDLDLVLALGAAFSSLRGGCDISAFMASAASATINALNVASAASGVALGQSSIVTLDTFATYYNLTDATKWQCLFAPDFLELYADVVGAGPSAHNTYYEVLQSVVANALGKLIVGTGFLSPGSIDSAKYAGGFGQVKATGITGSATVTVTGTWRKTDGTTATGDGTASVSTDGTVALTPPFTSALLLAVTNIAAGTGITAGTIYAEAAGPSGRSNPPT